MKDQKLIIRKESSCFNNLKWRIFITQQIPHDQFISQLITLDYQEKIHPLYPKIIEMSHTEGHSIIFVPKTNRIQLKLNIDLEEHTRIEKASIIAQDIIEVFKTVKYQG